MKPGITAVLPRATLSNHYEREYPAPARIKKKPITPVGIPMNAPIPVSVSVPPKSKKTNPRKINTTLPPDFFLIDAPFGVCNHH